MSSKLNQRIIRHMKPLSYFSDGSWLAFSRWKLYRCYADGKKTFLNRISTNFKRKICSCLRILQRRFYLDQIQGIVIDDNNALIFEHHVLFLLNKENDAWTLKPLEIQIPNLKVLNFCKKGKDIYFGDYGYDTQKREKSIYKFSSDDLNVSVVYTFQKGEINHVHNLYYDSYRKRFIVLTGDFGDSAAIYEANEDFSELKPILFGEQKYRSCQCIASKESLYYFTDSPFSTNYLRMLKFFSNSVEEENLCEMYGSCIYGMLDREQIIVSTTVENQTDIDNNLKSNYKYNLGEGIKGWYSEVVVFNAENCEVKTIARYKKDILPMLPFGYGCVQFPYNYKQGFPVVYYGYALKNIDGHTVVIGGTM